MENVMKKENDYYCLAKEAIERGEAETALFNVRKALEKGIKALCAKCNIDTYDVDLHDLIQKLYDFGIVSKEETALLHHARMKANYGVHAQDDEKEATIDDAKEGLYLLEQSLSILKKCFENTEKLNSVSAESNVPMSNPDYYSPNRRYYGMWCNCYTKPDLMRIPEYVELYRRATKGDIQAMLDIAVGFLPKQIQWGKFQTVCLSYDYFRGYHEMKTYTYFKEKLYDVRYYYWISKAAKLAAENVLSGKYVPLKYIATALLEALKISCIMINDYSVSLRNRNHFDMLTDMYEADKYKSLTCSVNVLLYLSQLIGKYGFDIISPVHEETDINKVKYLYIISQSWFELMRLYNGKRMTDINDNIAISKTDLKKPLFYSVDKYKNNCNSNRRYYRMLIDTFNEIYLKDTNVSVESVISSEMCIYCGKPCNDSDKFCPHCGKPLYNSHKESGSLYHIKEFCWLNKVANGYTNNPEAKSDALFNMGYMYCNGIGIKQDFDKGIEWYKKAADAGNSGAMNNIGYMYFSGEGVKQDYSKAYKWYKKAADARDSVAMSNIGYLYEHGEGVKQDYNKALEWYTKAFNEGDEDAKTNIEEIKKLLND